MAVGNQLGSGGFGSSYEVKFEGEPSALKLFHRTGDATLSPLRSFSVREAIATTVGFGGHTEYCNAAEVTRRLQQLRQPMPALGLVRLCQPRALLECRSESGRSTASGILMQLGPAMTLQVLDVHAVVRLQRPVAVF